MAQTLDYLIGVSLAGKYRLDECVGQDGTAAYFLTSHGPLRERAVLKLIPEDASAGIQLERWRRAAALSHPNLLRLLDSGRVGAPVRPTDGSFLYAVFECPDDNLESALARAPLTDEEERGIYEAVSDALRYLHAQELVHGAVDAGHIVAVGDAIKLTSDAVREPGPGLTPADDLRALERLLRRTVPPPVEAAAPLPAQSASAAARPAPESESPAPSLAPEAESRNPPSLPRWTYAGLAAPLLALLLVLLHRPEPENSAVQKPAPQAAAPTKAAQPVQRQPQPEAARTTVSHGAWRVIAYTYSGLAQAEHAARRINGKWPAFHAEVFSPKGRKSGPHFVSLGGRMSRADAEKLQRAARSKGLPRDTFVRNYAE